MGMVWIGSRIQFSRSGRDNEPAGSSYLGEKRREGFMDALNQ